MRKSKIVKVVAFVTPFVVGILYFMEREENFGITPFDAINRIDTLQVGDKTWYYKWDHYLVSGYEDNDLRKKQIDEFACSHKDTAFANYAEYFIVFYKKSRKTNNENIRKNPDDYFDYSGCDFLYEYKWRDRRFNYRENRTGLMEDDLFCE